MTNPKYVVKWIRC